MIEFGEKRQDVQYRDRPGCYGLLVNPEKEVAILSIGAEYFLPGGGIEKGEDDLGCLERELMEELGYSINDCKKLGVATEYIQSQSSGRHYRIEGRYYRIFSYQAVDQPIEEDHELLWTSPDQAISLLTRDAQKWAVAQMKESFSSAFN